MHVGVKERGRALRAFAFTVRPECPRSGRIEGRAAVLSFDTRPTAATQDERI